MCEKSHVYKFMTWECRMDTPVKRMSVISFWQKPAKELPNDNIRQHVQRKEPRPLEIGLMCPYNGFIDRSCVKLFCLKLFISWVDNIIKLIEINWSNESNMPV